MSFSFVGMMAGAGLVVKFVMFCLLVFSLLAWGIIIKKYLLFRRARNASADFLEEFWISKTLKDAYKAARDSMASPEAAVFISGYHELRKLKKIKPQDEPETLQMRLATMDNLKRAVRKAQLIEADRFESSLSFLATTGSATPFIGLFGTVWGILTSFQEIGERGSASLAVVAPGISEALVATAAGLAVAIPAVIFYNFYSNKLAVLESEVDNFSTDFLNLIERDILSKG